jgi:hypothetical protein
MSFFQSHLLYCTNIYTCTSQSNINKIFLQQKKAIRITTNSGYTVHTAPLFNILPLARIITNARLTLMHSVYYGHAPSSFSNTWQTQAQHNPDLNLQNATDIYCTYHFHELISSKECLYMPCLTPGTLMTLSITMPTEPHLDMHFKNSYTRKGPSS